MKRVAPLCVVALAGCGRIGFDESGDAASGNGMFAIQDIRLVRAGDPTRMTLADPLDGARIDVSSWIPTPGFAVEAIVEGMPDVVYLDLNGLHWDENVSPYVSRGDDGQLAAYFDRELRVGMNSVKVSTASGPSMTLYDQRTVSFELDVPLAAGAVTGFSLVDTQSGATLQPLTDGSTISIATLPAQIDIEATTSPAIIGNVKFNIAGVMPHSHSANWPPYRAYDYSGFAPQQGTYTLDATPHDRGDGTGATGSAMTISFTFIP